MTICARSHYATVVEALKDSEIYQHGDDDCLHCLERMADKHAAIAENFRSKLAALVHAGAKGSSPHAMCHECAEVVESINGELAPHHGTSGDGCPLNNETAQIYLHPRVADLIANLQVDAVFSVRDSRRPRRAKKP